MPAIERVSGTVNCVFVLPDRGLLSLYQVINSTSKVKRYRRFLPNVISRALEVIFFSRSFDGPNPLLVLGDLPLRVRSCQTVFVQTPHLIGPNNIEWSFLYLKYVLIRAIFNHNTKYVDTFIVQTERMKRALAQSYPSIADRIQILAQPVPTWLLQSGLRRTGRLTPDHPKLRLIYPAASYPHKNHTILSRIDCCEEWPVSKLVLTIIQSENPAPDLSWVECRSLLPPADMVRAYAEVDALLFLSKDESYGFPLVEAMFVGLPIVCPDLSYARTLCGDEAIYFDPDCCRSLRFALSELQKRLKHGWWPCWTKSMRVIPNDWEAVASRMLEIAVKTSPRNSI